MITEKNGEGCSTCTCDIPCRSIARPLNKYLSLDFLGEAEGVYYFKDAGVTSGPTYTGDESDYAAWVGAHCASIIDAEEMNRSLAQVRAFLARHHRPRIVAEEPVPSPHPYLDSVLPHGDIQPSERKAYFLKIREATR